MQRIRGRQGLKDGISYKGVFVSVFVTSTLIDHSIAVNRSSEGAWGATLIM